jgi:prepilin-type processing-associated H-X9-DG protein
MRGESSEFSDETLLGYLLGGLTDEESSQIEAALFLSSNLRQRVEDLKGLLDPLTSSNDVYEPRSDLVKDTLAWISNATQEELQPNNISSGDPIEVSEVADAQRLDWSDAPTSVRVAWLDSLVTIAAGIIFFSFLFPSIWQWRESSRRIACAENIRNIGAGIASYVDLSPSGQLPPIEIGGTKTFAGMYAIHLRDLNLLDSSKWVHCPSNRPLSILSMIPTSEQFLSSTPEQQQILRYLVGGNYAYHLGVWINGRYQMPKLESPVRFAVLGDMWPSSFGAVDITEPPPMLHGERVANMLFNDGSIRLIRLPSQQDAGFLNSASIDNPFLNQDQQQDVGIGIHDACLGPSYWQPSVERDRTR